MLYTVQQNELEQTIKGMPSAVSSLFPGRTIITLIEEVGNILSLTYGEIGEVCELVEHIITKKREPKAFEEGLVEKLDEDNREKIPQLVSLMSEKVFSKLLPALGIKIPIEFAVKVNAPMVEGIEVAKVEPVRPAPFKRVETSTQPLASSTAVPPPIVRGALFSGVSAQPPTNLPTGNTPFFRNTSSSPDNTSTPKVSQQKPLMEMAHGQVSAQPLESLLRMLNNKVSDKELARQFEKLPIKLKEALRSVDSARKIIDIGRKNGLHVDQIGELGAETGMVILGFSRPNQFVSQLRKRLDLPEGKLKAVAEDVNAEIFVKIREALKQIHGEEIEAPSTPIPIKPTVQTLDTRDARLSTPPVKKTESENIPDKATILRDIENPKPLWFRDPAHKTPSPVPVKPPPLPVKPPTAPIIASQPPQVSSTTPQATQETPPPARPQMQSPQTSIPQTPSVPELQKPPLPVTSEPFEKHSALTQKADLLRGVSPTIAPPRPTPSTPAPMVPKNEASAPKVVAPPAHKSIIEEKLSGQVVSAQTTRQPTSDPYREPLA